VHQGAKRRGQALADYAAFSDSHRWKFEAMLRVQQLVPKVPPRVLAPALNAIASKKFVDWSFGHYLEIAPPGFATQRTISAVPASSKTTPRMRVGDSAT
jgi:digeranylgeranylglycerophospholipid reductase